MAWRTNSSTETKFSLPLIVLCRKKLIGISWIFLSLIPHRARNVFREVGVAVPPNPRLMASYKRKKPGGYLPKLKFLVNEPGLYVGIRETKPGAFPGVTNSR